MRLASSFICLTLLSQIAFAQGETQAPPAAQNNTSTKEQDAQADKKEADSKPEKSPKSERVQVTGTRIKRIDVETAAPTVVLDKKMIEQSGATNLGEVLKKSASLSPTGNFTGESRFVASGAATVDLLGLGSSRTLVLLNGKRIPTSGSVEAVNIGSIPTGLIERIEIVAGANSAVYGADAVGGVVNIILKKRQDGGEVSAFKTWTLHPGGEEMELTATQGVDFGSTNVNFGVGYKLRNSIDQRNRDLDINRPGFDYAVSTAPPGTYSLRINKLNAEGKTEVGKFAPSPNCPAENQNATNPSQPDVIYCTGRRDDLRAELIPEQKNWYAATTFNSEIGDATTLSGILSFASNLNTVTITPWPRLSQETVFSSFAQVSRDEAVRLGIIDPNSTDVASVDILAVNPEARLRQSTTTYQNYMAGLYLDTTILDDVNLQLSAAHTANKLTGVSKQSYDSDKFRALVLPQNGRPAYNPIDPERDIAAFNDIYRRLESKEDSAYSTVDVFVGSDLGELPGGKATLGVGAAYSYETFKLTPDKNDQRPNEAGSPLFEGTYADAGEGNRTTVSVYSEIFAPMTTIWDLEGALRFDNFNDFSSRVNYGLGSKVKPFSSLALRGRAASSFKAPPLTYLHQEGGGGYYGVDDPAACQREKDQNRPCDGVNTAIYSDQPGTKDLDPEIGQNFSAGLIFEPLPGLTLISDHYWIDLKGTFGRDENQLLVDKFYEQHPYTGTEVGPGEFDVDGNTVITDKDGIISQIRRPYKNIGKTQVRALDTKLAYSIQLPAQSRLGFESQFFKMLSYKVKDNNESPLRQRVGFLGIPPWRLNNQVSFGAGDHDFVLASRTTARQWADPETSSSDFENGVKIGTYTEYDAVYGWTTPWNGNLQLGVNNIFDTIGGVVANESPGREQIAPETGTYSYIGRAYYARVTQRF